MRRLPSLETGVHELELHFARPVDLQDPQIGTLFILSGQVLVQTIVPSTTA